MTIDSQRLRVASDIAQFLLHWKELEVVWWRYKIVLMNICQNRKPAVSQIFMSTLLHERKMIKEKISFPRKTKYSG